MVSKTLSLIALVVLALSTAASAQTVHTFKFNAPDYNSGTAAFTKIDGNDPNCAIGYCGSIQIRGIGISNTNPWWGMEAPDGPVVCNGSPICSWQFPNGGFLLENITTPEQGQLVWDNPGCSPTVIGCTGHTDTTIPFQGYGLGVTANVHATYEVFPVCKRYCDNDSDDPIGPKFEATGGTGTTTYVPPQ